MNEDKRHLSARAKEKENEETRRRRKNRRVLEKAKEIARERTELRDCLHICDVPGDHCNHTVEQQRR